MFSFSNIKNALFSAKGELSKMRSDLEKLKQRRAALRILPPPRDELAETVCQLVDEKASKFPAQLAKSLWHRIDRPLGKPPQVDLTFLTLSSGLIGVESRTQDVRGVENFLFYSFRDALKASIRKAIAEMPYPDQIAPKMADRMKEFERLEQEIPALEARISEVENELREAVAL